MATGEQKQAVNAASASVQESCHCMHCNELLITLSVWGNSGELATLAQDFVFVCVCVFCIFSVPMVQSSVCLCMCDLRIQGCTEQMSGDTSC